MKKYIQLTLVLLIIAAVSGIVLGATYELTKGPIEQVLQDKINNNMNEWFPTVPIENKKDNAEPDHPEVKNDKNVNDIYDAKDKDGNIVGYVFKVKAPGSYGGGMVLLVGIDIEGKVVGYSYATFNESGPGANLRSSGDSFNVFEALFKLFGIDLSKEDKASFNDQFIGKSGDIYYNSPLDKNVDIVSGATYTSKATIQGIDNALQYYNEHMKVEVGTDG